MPQVMPVGLFVPVGLPGDGGLVLLLLLLPLLLLIVLNYYYDSLHQPTVPYLTTLPYPTFHYTSLHYTNTTTLPYPTVHFPTLPYPTKSGSGDFV